ncbi:Auxin response factor [Thalictrum thalictroides]|uniref:Auxin response factor n=1 Tax=Thalictrum thalictroides TaxID=46969 RepID=A0A7J6WZ98_THATH|nr:Auxin response factor [Thalictrum thalictroides]
MASVGSTLLDGLCPYSKELQEALRCANVEANKDAVYNELWHACAGPNVRIPVVGDKVLYFPQGHLEQVQMYANSNQEHNLGMPVYTLPYKIPCMVINVQLKAEVETDEVYAQVTLLPETKRNHVLPKEILPSVPQRIKVPLFSKAVTTSDTSTHGGFSVLRRHAEACFPRLDMSHMSQDPPAQELITKDLHGVEWRFRHIYRGAPKRHLITSGWSAYVNAKRIEPDDNFIFLCGENGDFRVGVRRSKNSAGCSSVMSVLTSRSMQLGVVATAYHAFSTGTMFSVYYRPRISPSEFIIPYHEYMKSTKSNFPVGMTFKLKFIDPDLPPESFVGTIDGIEGVDPVRWAGSKWRCLKVKWNGLSTVARPERVSPWEIDPFEISVPRSTPVPILPKRPRVPYVSSAFVNQGVGPVSQGQETSGTVGAPNSEIHEEPSFAQWIVPSSSSDSGQVVQRRRLEQPSRITVHASTTVYPSNVLPSSSSRSVNLMLGLASCNPQTFTAYGTNMLDGNWSVPQVNMNNSTSQGSASLTGPLNNTSCMLFGVDLLEISPDIMSAPAEASTNTQYSSQVPLARSSGNLEANQLSQSTVPTNSSGLVKHCQNCSISRSCIKVVCKFGSALGRVVDLTSLNSYDELMHELDQMFDFKGTLEDQNSDWRVIYMDADGDEISMYGAKVAHLPKGAAGESVNHCALKLPSCICIIKVGLADKI